MIRTTDLDTFSEATGAWEQLLVITVFGKKDIGIQPVKTAFMLYQKPVWKLVICRTATMRYYRWAWFELDVASR